MADIDSDSDIDAETLQAQIDMSMAYAQDIVSGWMKASGTSSNSVNGSGSGSVASGKKRDVEKELEEMMKRPPRCVYLPSSANVALTDWLFVCVTLYGAFNHSVPSVGWV